MDRQRLETVEYTFVWKISFNNRHLRMSHTFCASETGIYPQHLRLGDPTPETWRPNTWDLEDVAWWIVLDWVQWISHWQRVVCRPGARCYSNLSANDGCINGINQQKHWGCVFAVGLGVFVFSEVKVEWNLWIFAKKHQIYSCLILNQSAWSWTPRHNLWVFFNRWNVITLYIGCGPNPRMPVANEGLGRDPRT